MKTLQEQIKQFKQETGYTLEVRDGEPYYVGSLDLQGTWASNPMVYVYDFELVD